MSLEIWYSVFIIYLVKGLLALSVIYACRNKLILIFNSQKIHICHVKGPHVTL